MQTMAVMVALVEESAGGSGAGGVVGVAIAVAVVIAISRKRGGRK
ncbi:MAG: hypothetical protein ACI8QZ_000298 [Chlamydiales bacterium]|jgi:hypothetical protein